MRSCRDLLPASPFHAAEVARYMHDGRGCALATLTTHQGDVCLRPRRTNFGCDNNAARIISLLAVMKIHFLVGQQFQPAFGGKGGIFQVYPTIRVAHKPPDTADPSFV